jgi:DNA-binding transcriptional MocR family regulator
VTIQTARLAPVSLDEWASPFKLTKESQVADFLRERIICGFFARGQKLKQAEIAAMLDISITPVREALKMLEAQGFCDGGIAATAPPVGRAAGDPGAEAGHGRSRTAAGDQ